MPSRRAVEVRRAGPDDVDLLLAVSATARDEDGLERGTGPWPTASSRDRLVEALGRPDVEVHLALADAEAVGVVVLRVGELLVLTGAAAVRVDQLYVVPEWRRRGLAHHLLGAVLSSAERTGAEEVTCVVPAGGREAHRFLARLGFSRLVTLRAVPVARLRTKLAGEHERSRKRVALDALVARRRRQLDRPATPSGGLPAVGAGAVLSSGERRPPHR